MMGLSMDDSMELDADDNRPSSPLRSSASTSKGKTPAKFSLLPSRTGGAIEDTLPWVEKYRPAGLDEVIAHSDIISSVSKFIDENKLPHLLFYGPPGTGKTSMILACARKLYGPKYKSMILELNASDDRGIDVVREQIKNFASTKKIFRLIDDVLALRIDLLFTFRTHSSGFKLIILDEADAMTQVAQNALRRIVEKYTQNVRFCIICNYVSKIIPALQSRCTKFRFAPIKEDLIRTRLDHVVEAENINITEGGRKALLKLSKGDMRRMLNILQAVNAAFPVADELSVYTCVGAPLPGDIEKIADWLFADTFDLAHSKIKSLKDEKGLALADIIGELHSVLGTMELPPKVRSLLLIKFADVELSGYFSTFSRCLLPELQIQSDNGV
ncbi:hypothetical protein HDU82_005473 [Entophlyctis luteolus]|nr:hypothetical protein HDU82_005473 [Entophlyctis luteolus]